MPTYAIGDVQGCFAELEALLVKINFNERNDRLWFTGDLVNRGPQSLAVLRLAKRLNAVTVLGNHDLHLLAISEGIDKHGGKDTIDDVLKAKDRDELLHWLRHLPLLHQDKQLGYTMVHAGLPPQWDLKKANALTAEVEKILQSDDYRELLSQMYGNIPNRWSPRLTSMQRYRFIINACTRMRYCDDKGTLDFRHKEAPGSEPAGLQPWFSVASRKTRDDSILFGHWATIYHGNIQDFGQYNVCPLDTGCVWGGKLTAMRLDDGRTFQVPSRQPKGSE